MTPRRPQKRTDQHDDGVERRKGDFQIGNGVGDENSGRKRGRRSRKKPRRDEGAEILQFHSSSPRSASNFPASSPIHVTTPL